MINYSQGIDVLLLSYNGEKYIEEQITSIQKQLTSNDSVIISDDGSTDSTLEIIDCLTQASDVPIQVAQGPKEGVISNFFSGISNTTSEYVLISDQDDVWLPDKVSLFKEKMVLSNNPHLIFSDAYVWDGGKEPGISFWKKQHLIPELSRNLASQAFRNNIQGASMAINRALIEQLNFHESILMHDWWCGLIACTLGKIDYIETPTLLYRQHANNQLGASTRLYPSQRARNAKKIFRQITGFHDCFENQLNSKDAFFIKQFEKALKGNLANRIEFLTQFKLRQAFILRTLALYVSILFIKDNNSHGK